MIFISKFYYNTTFKLKKFDFKINKNHFNNFKNKRGYTMKHAQIKFKYYSYSKIYIK